MRKVCRYGRNLWNRLPCRLLIVAISALLLGVAVGRTFLGSVSLVNGMSMAPTFQPGTWVYTSPITGPLERGDIVTLDDGNKECAIKRLVGMPGEPVYLQHGYVFINGKILVGPYVS